MPGVELSNAAAAWLPVADWFIKATLVLAAAAVVARLMHRRSAAARHLVWTAALLASLTLPLLSVAVPAWQVPLIRIATTPDGSAAPSRPPRALTSSAIPSHAEPGAYRQERLSSPTVFEPPVARTAATSIGWAAVGAALWAAGALAVFVYLLLGILSVRRILSHATVGAAWVPLAERIAGETGVRQTRFRTAPRGTMPMTLGILRPVVLLPEDANDWPEERLRVVLLHELAHVKRADCLTHMVSLASCALYWMNPLVWIASRQARAERERACDDMVLASGTARGAYASELIEIARSLGIPRGPLSSHAALGMAHRSQLEGRLMSILDPSVPRTGLSRRATVAVAAAALVALAPLAAIQPWAGVEARAEAPSLDATTPSDDRAVPQARPAPRAAARRSVEQRRTDAGLLDDAIGDAIQDVLREIPTIVDAAMISAKIALEPDSKGTLDREAAAALREALTDVDAEVREAALLALTRHQDPAALEALVETLRSGSADAREKAASGLGRLRDRRAFEPLQQALRDELANVREQVVFALGQLRDERALDSLLESLRDVDADVREQSAFALGQLGSREAVEELSRALRDVDEDVREQAAFALGQIGDPRASRALAEALKDVAAEVRRQVAFALSQLEERKK